MSETDIDEIGLAHNAPATDLAPGDRRALRARAHHLHPVVSVGQHGLTPAVLHEIDVALAAHELVKVRVFNDDRGEREAMLQSICRDLACAPVQHLGKLLILWRPRPASGAAQDTARDDARGARVSSKRAAKKAGAKKTGARKASAKKPATGPGANRGTRPPKTSDVVRTHAAKTPRRARGQPLTEQDAPERPRSPKAPRKAPASPKAPRGKRRSAVPDPTHGSGASRVTRMAPAVAARVPGRRTAGGPAGVPRAPNPRRRRTPR